MAKEKTKYPRNINYDKFMNAVSILAKHKDWTYRQAWDFLIDQL